MRFEIIDGAKVTIFGKGLYKIYDIYKCEDLLYFKVSGGYCRLRNRNETGIIGLKWVDFDGIKVKKAAVFSALEEVK